MSSQHLLRVCKPTLPFPSWPRRWPSTKTGSRGDGSGWGKLLQDPISTASPSSWRLIVGGRLLRATRAIPAGRGHDDKRGHDPNPRRLNQLNLAASGSGSCARTTRISPSTNDRHPPDDRPVETEVGAKRRHWQDRTFALGSAMLQGRRHQPIPRRECRFRFLQGRVLPWFSLERMTTGPFTRVMDQAVAAVRQ